MKNRKVLYITMLFGLLYVLLGTITVMVSFPKYRIMGFDYNNFLWIPLVILTLPVNILLFGLVIVDNSILSISILQAVVFLIFWFISYKSVLFYLKLKKRKKK